MSNFAKIGKVIKSYRLAADESVEDLSGAVEVEPQFIFEVESGKKVPSEDILALIVNHFQIQPDEAVELFEIAGYEAPKMEEDLPDEEKEKQINVNLPSDKPILYTDRVHVVSNNYGVVLNFIQGVGPNGPAQVVSRVGMSHEHAKSVIEVLKKSIDNSEEDK